MASDKVGVEKFCTLLTTGYGTLVPVSNYKEGDTMFSVKGLKIKLIYMGFGGIIAIIGMLFGIGMLSSVTAQRDKFGEIECTGLSIVDAQGKAKLVLAIDGYGGLVTAYSRDGKTRASMGIDGYGGLVEATGRGGRSKATLGVDGYGGLVKAFGKDGVSQAFLVINKHGGRIDTYGNNRESALIDNFTKKFEVVECTQLVVVDSVGNPLVVLSGSENGGRVNAYGKDKGSMAFLGMTEDGGHVGAIGKGGTSMAGLTITETGGVVIASGRDGVSKAVLGIDENGGRVAAYSKDGKSRAELSVFELGGRVSTLDKNGQLNELD